MATGRLKSQLTMRMATVNLSFKGFLILLCIVSMPIDLCAARRIESKPTVSVSGIVFCNQCSQENELAVPLQGAQVKLQCENSLPSSAVTNKNGHFTFTIDTKYYAQHGVGKCKVLLGKSPSSQCDVSTTVGNGVSGAALIKVPATAGSLNEEKFSVGPFVYKPSHASCKSSANLMFHHIEDTYVPSGVASHTKDSEMLTLFPNALPPHPHPIKPLPLKPQAPTKAPAPSTPGTKAPAPSSPATKAPPPSTTPGKAPPPSTTPSKAPPPSTTPGKAPPPSTTPSKAPPPSTTPGKAPPPSTTPSKAPPPSTTPGKAPLPSTTPAPKPGPGKPPLRS